MAGWHHAMDMNLGKLQEMVRDGEAWRATGLQSQTQLETGQQQQLGEGGFKFTFHFLYHSLTIPC